MDEERWLIEQVTGRFEQLGKEALGALAGKDEGAAEQLKAILAGRDKEPVMRVAFVGQYSAGKSTIISALTGERSINIDADIATDRATDYDWSQIKLTDTPGLWTERKDHDRISEQAIREADLLVFVVTSDLFNSETLRNFKKLAFEESYRHKMLLVVNKMSMEEGSYAELRGNYTESLNEALKPHGLAEFRVAFVDAADYLGSGGDRELMALSHFGDLIDLLNRFVAERGLMGRLDQPVREALHLVENAQVKAGAGEESRIFFTLMERMESRIQRAMRQSQLHVDTVTAQLRNDIVTLGSRLAGQIGTEGADIEGEARQAEVELERLAQRAGDRLATALEEERQKLDEEVQEIFTSELAQAYFERVQRSGAYGGENVGGAGMESLKKNFEVLNSIGSQLSKGVATLMGNQVSGLFTASATAGSNMHKLVYGVGKWFGATFKPWQAVNIAKTIGNVAKVAGALLAVLSFVIEVGQVIKERQREEKIREARGECRNSFIQVAEELRQQFEAQFDAYKGDLFLPALAKISAQRQEAVANQSQLSAYQEQLGTVIKGLRSLTQVIAGGEGAQ